MRSRCVPKLKRKRRPVRNGRDRSPVGRRHIALGRDDDMGMGGDRGRWTQGGGGGGGKGWTLHIISSSLLIHSVSTSSLTLSNHYKFRPPHFFFYPFLRELAVIN